MLRGRPGVLDGQFQTGDLLHEPGRDDTGIPASEIVFDLVAVTIALSIVLHSSTDVPIAHALRVEPPDNLPHGQPQRDARDTSTRAMTEAADEARHT